MEQILAVTLQLATFGVLLARFVPQLNVFLEYGKTWQRKDSWLNKISAIPRDWFSHFYIYSFGLTLILTFIYPIQNGPLYFMVLIQAIRRSYEDLTKPKSQASMHVFHYLVGILFYTIQSIAPFEACSSSTFHTIFALILFVVSSWYQHVCHVYLVSLPKYTLPHFGSVLPQPFQYTLSPHYFFEILIYTAYLVTNLNSMIAWSSLVWVIVCLSVSAEKTKSFYSQKFSLPQNGPYSALIPYLF